MCLFIKVNGIFSNSNDNCESVGLCKEGEEIIASLSQPTREVGNEYRFASKSIFALGCACLKLCGHSFRYSIHKMRDQ